MEEWRRRLPVRFGDKPRLGVHPIAKLPQAILRAVPQELGGAVWGTSTPLSYRSGLHSLWTSASPVPFAMA
jgi:hypothetical protein